MARTTDQYIIDIKLDIQNDADLKAAISQLERMAKIAPKTQKAITNTGRSMNTAAKSTRNYGNAAQNVGYQVQDLAVQIQGGVDPMRAMSQQLPQMLVGFGAWGAAIGVVTALLPTLVQLTGDTGDEVGELATELEQAATAWDDYESALSRMEKTGSAVDTVIANLLKTIASVEQQQAISALKQEAADFVDTARTLEKIPKPEEPSILGWIKELAAEVSAINTGGDIKGIAEEAKAIGDAVVQADRFGGDGALAEFNKIIADLNSQNLGETIISLTSLADRMEGVASPGAITRIREMALSLNALRTSTSTAVDGGGGGAVGGSALEGFENVDAFIQKMGDLQGVITDAKIAGNDYNQMQREFIIASEGVTIAATEEAEAFSLLDVGIDTFGKSFDTMLNGVLMGTQSISDGFRDMSKVVIAQVLKVMAQMAIAKALTGVGYGELAARIAPEGYAKGGVFDNGGVTPFAKGGVVSSPTVFPFKNGIGLMGEAGAEAIMPLSRGKDGKLGVAGGGMNVTINNNAPGVDVRARQGEDGLTIDVVMKQIASAIGQGGNDLANAFEGTYSLGRGRAVY